MLDLGPATRTLTTIVEGVRDDQLDEPTPCTDTSIGDLLDHVDGLSVAFTAAAAKAPLPPGHQGASADASKLGSDWRTRIPQRLAALAEAWRAEDAWTGTTHVGGQDLPSEVAGVVALDEVIVHGWDLAVASGQPYRGEPELVEAAFGFVCETVERNPQGVPGLFGPARPVADDAPPLDRLIATTGRDPSWQAGVSGA